MIRSDVAEADVVYTLDMTAPLKSIKAWLILCLFEVAFNIGRGCLQRRASG